MHPRAHATSLESIEVLPRTPIPRTPLSSRRGHTYDPSPSDEGDEVELTLLGEEERRAAAAGLGVEEEQTYLAQADGKKPFSARDKQAIVLLIILCTCTVLYSIRLLSYAVRSILDLIQGFPVSFDIGSHLFYIPTSNPVRPGPRIHSIHSPRASILLRTRRILALWLSILSQALLVTNRRFSLLPLYWSSQIVDYTYAAHSWNDHASHVLPRRRTNEQCK